MGFHNLGSIVNISNIIMSQKVFWYHLSSNSNINLVLETSQQGTVHLGIIGGFIYKPINIYISITGCLYNRYGFFIAAFATINSMIAGLLKNIFRTIGSLNVNITQSFPYCTTLNLHAVITTVFHNQITAPSQWNSSIIVGICYGKLLNIGLAAVIISPGIKIYILIALNGSLNFYCIAAINFMLGDSRRTSTGATSHLALSMNSAVNIVRGSQGYTGNIITAIGSQSCPCS